MSNVFHWIKKIKTAREERRQEQFLWQEANRDRWHALEALTYDEAKLIFDAEAAAGVHIRAIRNQGQYPAPVGLCRSVSEVFQQYSSVEVVETPLHFRLADLRQSKEYPNAYYFEGQYTEKDVNALLAVMDFPSTSILIFQDHFSVLAFALGNRDGVELIDEGDSVEEILKMISDGERPFSKTFYHFLLDASKVPIPYVYEAF
jgi:hypothetical protein